MRAPDASTHGSRACRSRSRSPLDIVHEVPHVHLCHSRCLYPRSTYGACMRADAARWCRCGALLVRQRASSAAASATHRDRTRHGRNDHQRAHPECALAAGAPARGAGAGEPGGDGRAARATPRCTSPSNTQAVSLPSSTATCAARRCSISTVTSARATSKDCSIWCSRRRHACVHRLHRSPRRHQRRRISRARGRNGRSDQCRRVLFERQPFANHNGGEVTVRPRRHALHRSRRRRLQGDPQHNGQNRVTLLAKILRIDPNVGGSYAYTVPADNPFVGVRTRNPRPGCGGSATPGGSHSTPPRARVDR